MVALFRSTKTLHLGFPDVNTVVLTDEKEGAGKVHYKAVSSPATPTTLHTIDVQHHTDPATYRVTESLVGGKKTYTVSALPALGAKFAGFTSTMETEGGLFSSKHLFQGPDDDHYAWSGKGSKLELLVPKDDNKEIAEFTPDDRILELKPSRFGKHSELDAEFVVATFFALLLWQDEYNKVTDSADALGRAKGRTWKERAEAAARPRAAESAATLAGAASYVSGLAANASKALQEKAAELQKK